MSAKAAARAPIVVGGVEVQAGEQARIEVPIARLYTGDETTLSLIVLHGRRPGPRIWLDAAIHGDELNGIRIIREVLSQIDPDRLAGTIIGVPVVNVFGLLHRSRYLPDRRDLNRSFPGSARGSLASRVAHLFMKTVVEGCDLGIDLHTAGPGRTNFPHLRIDTESTELRPLAEAFGAPLIYQAPEISGSLRRAVRRKGANILVYEAGQPQRFDEEAIEVGVAGVLRILSALEMWTTADLPPAPAPLWARDGSWVRASRSGVFDLEIGLGERVEKGQVLGSISDPFPARCRTVRAPCEGLVMGVALDPLVHQGDALVHLVRTYEAPDGPASPSDTEPSLASR